MDLLTQLQMEAAQKRAQAQPSPMPVPVRKQSVWQSIMNQTPDYPEAQAIPAPNNVEGQPPLQLNPNGIQNFQRGFKGVR